MASKVLVKMPAVPFAQVRTNKKINDSITLNRTEGIIVTSNKEPLARVAQLEQNVKFLQEQHQIMLSGLQNEVEILRQRNRDLQFQLIFAKNTLFLNSPSSSEDDSKSTILSPQQINVTPLQVELLEKELAELKLNLQETNTKNSYLSAIVEEQKKKLESFETEWNEIHVVNRGQEETELQQKLEDAERLIRRLRRENEDQRREIASLRVSLQNGENYHQHNNRGTNRRGSHHRGQRDHRFPPLHSQSYWHQNNSRSSRGQQHCDVDENDSSNGGITLPSLRNEESSSYTTHSNRSGTGNRRSGGGYQGNNTHQHRDGERKKYRGQNRGNKS